MWDTLGMRGTRSNNLILEDCFVPEEHWCVRTDNLSTLLDAAPTWGMGFSYTPVYLGVGIAAYRQACKTLKAPVPRGFAQPLSYHPDIRRRVAEMSVDLEAAQLLMYYAAWKFDTEGMTSATSAALLRAKYGVGEAVARITCSHVPTGGRGTNQFSRCPTVVWCAWHRRGVASRPCCVSIANLRQNPCTIDHSRIDEESYF